MGLGTEMEQEEKPKWLLELENRRQKPRLLAHEVGAGAPCIKCSSNCPGLDLHFWRKICKNCKCSRDDHDVPNDEFPQFDLLFGPSGRKRRKMVGKFEWTPPETTDELAHDYMNALPKDKLPIKGSAGAALRKTQLNKQLPLHDFNHEVCDDLTESERKQFEKYVENLKKYVGQGKVSKFMTPKPFDKSLTTPENASESSSPKHRYPATGQPATLRTPGSFVPKNPPPSNKYNHDDYSGIHQDENNLVGYPSRAESRQEVLHNPAYGKVSQESQKMNQYHHGLDHVKNNSNLAESTAISSPEYLNVAQREEKNSQYHHEISNVKQNFDLTNSDFVPGSRGYMTINQEIGKDCQHHHDYENVKYDFSLSNSTLLPGSREHLTFNQEIHRYNHEKVANNLETSTLVPGSREYPTTNEQNRNNSHPYVLSDVKTDNRLVNSTAVPNSQGYLNLNKNIRQNAQHPPTNAHQGINYYRDDNTIRNSGSRGHSPNPAVNYIESNLLSGTPEDLPGYQNISNNLPHPYHLERISSPKPGESCSERISPESHQWPNQTERLKPTMHNKMMSDAISPPSATYSEDLIGNTLNKKGLSRNWENSSSKYFENEDPSDQNKAHRENNPVFPQKDRELFSQKPIHTTLESYTGAHPDVIHSEHLNNPAFPEVVGSSKIMPNPAGAEFIGKAMQNLTMDGEKVQNCNECKERILVGDVVVTAEKAQDAAWHPGCFVCSVCNELLVDLVYFYYKGKLYCGRDLAGLLNIPRCFACDELIFVAAYTVAEGHNYHLKHFCCWDCDIPLAGQLYTSENDRPLCLPCYQKDYAKTCGTCKLVIAADQQGVAVKNLDFHATSKCFCCGNCKKSLLNGRIAVKENKPFCSKECITTFLNNRQK